MKHAVLKYFLVVSICVNMTNLFGNDSIVAISYPKDQSISYEATLSIVMDIKVEEIDLLTIITSMSEEKIDLKRDKKTYCKTITLRLGDNTISVRAYKNGVMVDEDIRKIYLMVDIYKQFKYPPKNYKQNFFHTDKKESKCVKCHDMTLNETPGIAFVDVTKSNCYQCHNTLTSYRYAHAPAVNWLCTSCHTGEAGEDNKEKQGLSKYLPPLPVNKECYRCHKSNKKLWDSYRYRHDPLDSGRCDKCHNPHSSPYRMFVRKPVDHICMGCHSNSHRIDDVQNYTIYTGLDTSKDCIKCHSPHATNEAFFLLHPEEK